jgi:hypothetical protein
LTADVVAVDVGFWDVPERNGLFPIVIFSAIRFSNRFAGPMVRIRGALKQIAQGETPPRLVLRDDDFWSDIVNDINEIADQLRQESPTSTA